MATTQTGIAPPDDTLQTNNPPGVSGGLVSSIPTATPPPPSATPLPPPTVPSYSTTPVAATTYAATPYSVPENATVQERVRSIVGEDSPLMQQAKQRAIQEMAQRGLVNSNLAIGAGHQAVIAQALPIAQQDAQTYATAATNTANQQNAASQFNAGSINTVGLTNAQQANAAAANNQQATVQLTDRYLTTSTQVALANLDSATRLSLSNLDTQTRQLLQTNQSASNAYVQAITNISNISGSNTLSATAKRNAIQTQLNLLNEQLRVINHVATTTPPEVTDLNLGQFFDATIDDQVASTTTTPAPNRVPTTPPPPPPTPPPSPRTPARGGDQRGS